jgi:hypothetical protein
MQDLSVTHQDGAQLLAHAHRPLPGRTWLPNHTPEHTDWPWLVQCILGASTLYLLSCPVIEPPVTLITPYRVQSVAAALNMCRTAASAAICGVPDHGS